jgi:hypothetical protein
LGKSESRTSNSFLSQFDVVSLATTKDFRNPAVNTAFPTINGRLAAQAALVLSDQEFLPDPHVNVIPREYFIEGAFPPSIEVGIEASLSESSPPEALVEELVPGIELGP